MIDDPSDRFMFRLAALFGMPVAELLARLSHDELVGWYAFYGLEPWGSQVEDERFGVLLSSITNLLRARWGAPQRIRPAECYPPRAKVEREKVQERKMAQAANAAWKALEGM